MKQEQKRLIIEIMNDDAKDRLYISPTKSNADMNIGVPKKTTAVEWLVYRIKNQHLYEFTPLHELELQAKQMEKKQIIEAYYYDSNSDLIKDDGEQYYNETYNK